MMTKLSVGTVAILFASLAMTVTLADDATPKPADKEPSKSLNVLLIGNSQCPTIVNQQLLEKLAASDKGAPAIKVGGCIKGGASLKSHWDAGTVPGSAREMIANGKWDYVVLQDIYFVEAANFQPYARLFHELIKKSGARTVLFGTASILSDYPKGFERQHRLHVDMGKELGVPIVDASQAYFRYFGDKPSPELLESLFAKDRAHPGLTGVVSLRLRDLQRTHRSKSRRPRRAQRDSRRGREVIAGNGLGTVSGNG